jgi:hypothetical protein
MNEYKYSEVLAINRPLTLEEMSSLRTLSSRALLDNSGGNFSAALYYLMLCGRYDERTRSFLLWPPAALDVSFVKEMDRLHQLTLAELVGHGVLSAEEHARIFRTIGTRSRMIFEHLEQLNLLVPVAGADSGEERSFDLSPVIHYAVTSALQQLHLLY